MDDELLEHEPVSYTLPRRGQVWWVRFSDGLQRPHLVLSIDQVVESGGPVLAVALGRVCLVENCAVRLDLEAGGVRPMWARCDLLRSFQRAKFVRCVGIVQPSELAEVGHKLAFVLGLSS